MGEFIEALSEAQWLSHARAEWLRVVLFATIGYL
jgi:hypothetical protein